MDVVLHLDTRRIKTLPESKAFADPRSNPSFCRSNALRAYQVEVGGRRILLESVCMLQLWNAATVRCDWLGRVTLGCLFRRDRRVTEVKDFVVGSSLVDSSFTTKMRGLWRKISVTPPCPEGRFLGAERGYCYMLDVSKSNFVTKQ